ncbi:MAG: hypothetical protein HZB23_11780 [Deltaproteobacteria bacterium]|nr:hypothetical protein [Deltaproteobacteria bacterium]
MKPIVISLFFLLICFMFTETEGHTVIKTKDEFQSAEGKKVAVEGKLFRSKIGDTLVCKNFSVSLRGFTLPKETIGKTIRLFGTAMVYKNNESREEWENRIKKEPPFTHDGYLAERFVLVK